MIRGFLLPLLIFWILNAFALYFTAKITPGLRMKGFGSAMLAALVLAILNATVLSALWMFSWPFGLTAMVVMFFILSGIMLRLTTGLVQGFTVSGWFSATIGAVILAVIQIVLFMFYNKLMGFLWGSGRTI